MADLRKLPGAGTRPAPADFLAGVRLAADLIDEAQQCRTDPAVWLEAETRDGVPMRAFVEPTLQRLRQRPELAPGFAAVLGDLLMMLADRTLPSPTIADFYRDLSFRDIVGGPIVVRSPAEA